MVNQSRKSGLSSESSADSQTNGSRSTKPRKSRSISPNTEVKDILLNMREESSKSKMRQFKLNNVRDWVAWFSRPRKENHDRKLFWPTKLPVNRLSTNLMTFMNSKSLWTNSELHFASRDVSNVTIIRIAVQLILQWLKLVVQKPTKVMKIWREN